MRITQVGSRGRWGLGAEVASESVSCENITALRIHALPMCCASVSSPCDSSLAQRQHPVPLSQVRAPRPGLREPRPERLKSVLGTGARAHLGFCSAAQVGWGACGMRCFYLSR